MIESADLCPGVLEALKDEVGGVYQRTVQIKQDCAGIMVQEVLFFFSRTPGGIILAGVAYGKSYRRTWRKALQTQEPNGGYQTWPTPG
jgi:hypothetical protein